MKRRGVCRCNAKKDAVKKAELNMSFSMIFSIILIVVFLVFAFYAIKKFLDFQCHVQIADFINEFKNDVDKIWRGGGSSTPKYTTCSKIDKICFTRDSNIYFEPPGSGQGLDPRIIEHIDIDKILARASGNDYFINKKDGKISMIIKKANYRDALVDIEGN